MRRQEVEPTENEHGAEEHPSWITIRANRVTSTPGARLFDSEVAHSEYVVVTIERTSRKRDLHRDWIHNVKQLADVSMSMAQWGAFVSSFGQGTGVPATLTFYGGDEESVVPSAPVDSRLGLSVKEVRETAHRSLEDIAAAYAEVAEAFDAGAGRKDMREKLSWLGTKIEHGPSNAEFAAKSLTNHVEKVITKARFDIEAMVLSAAANGQALEAGDLPVLELGEAEDPDIIDAEEIKP